MAPGVDVVGQPVQERVAHLILDRTFQIFQKNIALHRMINSIFLHKNNDLLMIMIKCGSDLLENENM